MIPPIDFYDLYDPIVPPAPPPAAGAVPFERLVDELRVIYAPECAAKKTWAKLNGVLQEVRALDVVTTDQLTVPLIARYIASRPPGQSPHTLASLLSSLKAACTYAEKCGYIKASPFSIRKMSKWVRCPAPVDDGSHLSREDIRKILHRMKRDIAERTEWPQWRARRVHALTAIVAYCALRRDEALRLHVVDVDLPGRIVHVVPRSRLKTAASAAPVPMPDALVPIVADWLTHRLDGPPGVIVPAGCPWLIPTINRKSAWLGGPPGSKALDVLKDAARRAGVEGATWQAFRVAWATHAEHFGLGGAMIQRVLRHTTERTSKRWYRKADAENLAAKVKGITF